MVTKLSELVETTQGTAVPEWLRTEVFQKRDEISKSLRETGTYTVIGPQGQEVVITAERKTAAAAS